MAITHLLKKSGSTVGWQAIANKAAVDTYLTKTANGEVGWQASNTARNILSKNNNNEVGWSNVQFNGITITHTNGTVYTVAPEDYNNFATNNSSNSPSSNPIWISSSTTIPRANVASVVIIGVTLRLRPSFLSYAFYNCINLTSVILNFTIDRDYTTSAQYYLTACFQGCTSLTTAPTIPALPSGVTSASYYLSNMFSGCTSLTTAPIIPALPSSVTSAYFYLSSCFYNCTSLTNALIPNIPAFTGEGITTLPDECTTDYAGGTCPATPDTPITNLAGFKAGYNYH